MSTNLYPDNYSLPLDELKLRLSSIPIDINKQIVDGYTNYISSNFYYNYYKIINFVNGPSSMQTNDAIYSSIVGIHNMAIATIEGQTYRSLINDSFYNIMYFSKYEKIFKQMILNAINSENITTEEKQYIIKLINIYHKKLHQNVINTKANQIDIFRLIAEFSDIIKYDNCDLFTLLTSFDLSNNILNGRFPINNTDQITLYDCIKIVLGDLAYYSLYDLVNGYLTPLPNNITFDLTGIGFFSLLQYVRIIDIMDIYLGKFKIQNIDFQPLSVNILQQSTSITVGKSRIKVVLADALNKIYNLNSRITLSAILMIDNLRNLSSTMTKTENPSGFKLFTDQLPQPNMGAYNFFLDLFSNYYKYVLITDTEFLLKCKILLTDIYNNVNLSGSLKVEYILKRFNLIFNTTDGLIINWIKKNGQTYLTYITPQINTVEFFRVFFTDLKNLLYDIINVLTGNPTQSSAYIIPIKNFIDTIILQAINFTNTNTNANISLLDQIGDWYLIENFKQISEDARLNRDYQTILQQILTTSTEINQLNTGSTQTDNVQILGSSVQPSVTTINLNTHIIPNIRYQFNNYKLFPYFYDLKITNLTSTKYELTNASSILTPIYDVNCETIQTKSCTNINFITNQKDISNYINLSLFIISQSINIVSDKISTIIRSPLSYTDIILQILQMYNKSPILSSNDNTQIISSFYSDTTYLTDNKLDRMCMDDLITISDKTNFIEFRNNLNSSYENILNKSFAENIIKTIPNIIPDYLVRFQLNEISKNINMNLFSRSVAKICRNKPYNIVKHLNSIIDDTDINTNIFSIIKEDSINIYPFFIMNRLPYKYDDNTTLVSAVKSKPVVSTASLDTTVYVNDTNTNTNGTIGSMIVSFKQNTTTLGSIIDTQPIKINIQLTKEDINYN
jgi:hypothetical protein